MGARSRSDGESELYRRVPADVACVAAAIPMTAAVVFFPLVSETPLRAIVGVPFVLFVPGYAMLSVVFPRAYRSAADSPDEDGGPSNRRVSRGLRPIERATLSVASSVTVVILLGILVELSPFRIATPTMFGSIAAFTLVACAGSVWRREQIPPDRRLRVPVTAWLRECRSRVVDPPTRVDMWLNGVLAVSLVFALWSVGYGTTDPGDGAITEVGLLTEQPDGEFAARGYPTNVSIGEPTSLALVVTNREHESVEYSVLVQLQRVQSADGTTVVEERSLREMRLTLDHNETRRLEYDLSVSRPGRYRLVFLLYRGLLPDDPSIDGAYREVHLWMNATSAQQ